MARPLPYWTRRESRGTKDGRAESKRVSGQGVLGRGGFVGLGRWGDVDVRRYESMSDNEREPVFSDESTFKPAILVSATS